MVQGLYIQDFVQLGSSTKLVQALQYMFYCSLVQIYKIAVTATQRNFWSSHKICNSAQLHAIAHGNGIRPLVLQQDVLGDGKQGAGVCEGLSQGGTVSHLP